MTCHCLSPSRDPSVSKISRSTSLPDDDTYYASPERRTLACTTTVNLTDVIIIVIIIYIPLFKLFNNNNYIHTSIYIMT